MQESRFNHHSVTKPPLPVVLAPSRLRVRALVQMPYAGATAHAPPHTATPVLVLPRARRIAVSSLLVQGTSQRGVFGTTESAAAQLLHVHVTLRCLEACLRFANTASCRSAPAIVGSLSFSPCNAAMRMSGLSVHWLPGMIRSVVAYCESSFAL